MVREGDPEYRSGAPKVLARDIGFAKILARGLGLSEILSRELVLTVIFPPDNWVFSPLYLSVIVI